MTNFFFFLGGVNEKFFSFSFLYLPDCVINFFAALEVSYDFEDCELLKVDSYRKEWENFRDRLWNSRVSYSDVWESSFDFFGNYGAPEKKYVDLAGGCGCNL